MHGIGVSAHWNSEGMHGIDVSTHGIGVSTHGIGVSRHGVGVRGHRHADMQKRSVPQSCMQACTIMQHAC
eukprot:350298-Chlamydomonas_euryale.AAC.3